MRAAPLTRWLLAAAFALALLQGLRSPALPLFEVAAEFTIAREMLATGEWRDRGATGLQPRGDTPLRHTPAVISLWVFGESAWAVQLPSALAAAGTLLLVAWIGRMLGSPRIGLASSGILLSCAGFFAFAHATTPEMLNTFWITAAIACFVRRSHGGGRWHEAGFFLAIGMGLLTDGWLAAIIPTLAVLGWNAGRRRSGLATVSMPWIPGAIVALALAVASVVVLAMRYGDLLEHLKSSGVFSFFGGRESARWRSRADLPFVFAAGTFPWLLVALGALMNRLALRKSDWRLSPSGWLLFAWVVPTLLILMAVGPRTFGDSLPVLPAFALWIASRGNWRDADPTRPTHGLAGFWSAWWYRVSLLCALAFVVSPALAIAAASLTLPQFAKYGLAPWFGPVLGVLALGCSGAVYLRTRRAQGLSRDRWDAFEEAGGAAIAVLGIGLYLLVGSQIDRPLNFSLRADPLDVPPAGPNVAMKVTIKPWSEK